MTVASPSTVSDDSVMDANWTAQRAKPNLRWWLLALLAGGAAAYLWQRAGGRYAWIAGCVGAAWTVHRFLADRQRPFFPHGAMAVAAIVSLISSYAIGRSIGQPVAWGLALIATAVGVHQLYRACGKRFVPRGLRVAAVLSLVVAALAGMQWAKWRERENLMVWGEAILSSGAYVTRNDFKRLTLGGPAATNEKLDLLSRCTATEWLMLHSAAIDDNGLAAVTTWKRLKYLQITDCLVTDEGLAQLAELKSLNELHLGGLSFTDNAIMHLMKLENLGKLTIVSDRVSPASVQRLQAELPYLEVMTFSASGVPTAYPAPALRLLD